MTSRSLRARHLIKEIDERCGGRELDLLSVSMTRGVIPRTEVTDKEARADDLSNYKVCKQGDIVVNRMSAYQGALGMSHQAGIVSPDYIVFRPFPGVEPRWLHHVMRSTWFVSEMSARIRGIGSIGTGNVRTPRVSSEEIRDIRVSVPGAQEQRAIADFLDSETARIDALIAKKQRVIDLLNERLGIAVAQELGDSRQGMRVKYCAEVLPGYAFSSDDFSAEESGPRLLRGINVNPGVITWNETVSLRANIEPPARYKLESGDIVLGMDRPFVSSGTRAAVVDTQSVGSYLVQRVCRLRTANSAAALLMVAALQDIRFKNFIEADLSGVSVPHLSDAQIGMYVVPDVVANGDPEVAGYVERMTYDSKGLTSLVYQQIELLREHREAFITAAVTGQIEIPGVAA